LTASSSPAHRPRLTLDGVWDFAFEGATARLAGAGHAIRSPGTWQAQFPTTANPLAPHLLAAIARS
jgi:hypothetical protein